MYIETPRMIIRNFTLEDAADLHDIFGDEETMKHCEPAYDFEKTKEFLASFCIGRKGAVAAVHKESGKVMDYAFKELHVHKVFAEAIDAEKSVGLMQKLGMQLEGIQRSQTKDNQGSWADLYFYGMLESDWKKR